MYGSDGTPELLRPADAWLADPEIHLIPHGYAGVVTIVFGAGTGEPGIFEGAARVYRIPEHGILLAKAGPNVGLSPAWRFFQETPDGERVPITRVWGGWVTCARTGAFGFWRIRSGVSLRSTTGIGSGARLRNWKAAIYA
jgi:hypothetical protein